MLSQSHRLMTLPFRPNRTLSSKIFYSSSSSEVKNVLIIGCNGALGQSVASTAPPNVTITGADVVREASTSSYIDSFIHVDKTSVIDITKKIKEDVKRKQFQAVICTAGGWASDPPRGDDDVVKYAEGVDTMLSMNLYPAVAGSLISMDHLEMNGLYVAIGATAALSPTSNMIGYGISKSALHHLVQSLGNPKNASSKLTDVFEDRTALAILPNILNTKSNRSAMPDADWNSWVDTDDIAREIWEWVENPELRPQNGSLIKAYNNQGRGTVFHLAR